MGGHLAAGPWQTSVPLRCVRSDKDPDVQYIVRYPLKSILVPNQMCIRDSLEDYIVNGQQIPYHLIDIVDPGYKDNVFEFQRDFLNAYDQVRWKERCV